MGIDDNIRVLEAGMKKARELVRQKLGAMCQPHVMGIVDEASNAREWTGFTGNAQTSYGGCVIDQKTVWQYRSDYGGVSVVHDKVNKGETVCLDNPVEGEPRRVSGDVNIRFSDSSSALDYVLNLPVPAYSLVDARFAFPLEYVNYLREHYANGGENPLKLMHQLASVAFKTMR